MLGYVLARAGVDVLVLEKHADFFRDFRGDTVHPSTLQVMYELGLLDAFLKVPHNEIREFSGTVGGQSLRLVDLRHVPGKAKFLAFMPQWDFLNFLAEQGRRLPSFDLRMETEAEDLIVDGQRITGIKARGPSGPLEVAADLVVAADGRSSTLRQRAGMEIEDLGVPIDVLWFRISQRAGDPGQTFGNIAAGGILVTIDRQDYFQCAFVIKKGGFDDLRARGIEYFRAQIALLAPFIADRVGEVKDWEDVKLLTVIVNRLKTWYRPGLLFIGDAAHAMSPIGGVGINLAIQDAVAAANILAGKLRTGTVSTGDLAAVQRRREFPTKVIQGFQLFVQDRVMSRVLDAKESFEPPLFFRLLDRFALLRRVPAWFIGIGPRPEHIRLAL
ncbi:MAG: FAD-dependent oxidoreductase [Candidatus Eremiobacteraeota bacterium]|nr:FAD-dependent oxidoreductase [Candidatus Eremiobacteraeota bacterium]